MLNGNDYNMKTYLADIIPRIQRYSKRLDQLTMLTNQHWVSINDITDTKTVYFFDSNGELDIFENGFGIDRGTWRLLDSNSLKLRLTNSTLLLRHGFFDENVIALKLDSTDRYAFFVNENKHRGELNTIEDIINFLEIKYLKGNKQSNGIGTKDPENLDDPNYGFEVVSEKEKYNFMWGKYIEYIIIYKNGRRGEVFKELKTGNFFYESFIYGQVVFNFFDEVVYENYLFITKI
jgi:hypothetical protein